MRVYCQELQATLIGRIFKVAPFLTSRNSLPAVAISELGYKWLQPQAD